MNKEEKRVLKKREKEFVKENLANGYEHKVCFVVKEDGLKGCIYRENKLTQGLNIQEKNEMEKILCDLCDLQ